MMYVYDRGELPRHLFTDLLSNHLFINFTNNFILHLFRLLCRRPAALPSTTVQDQNIVY